MKYNKNWFKSCLACCKRFDTEILLSVLAYLPVLFIIPLAISLFSENIVWYHSKQGIIIAGVWTIFLLSFYVFLLPWLVGLFLLWLTIVGINNASKKQRKGLPLVGFLAE
jgi:hypothetical protein